MHQIIRAAFLFTLVATILVAASLAWTFNARPTDDALLLDSTVGELAVWQTDQTATRGEPEPDSTDRLERARTGLIIWSSVIALLTAGGLVGFLLNQSWLRYPLLVALIGLDMLLFIVPPLDGDSTAHTLLYGVALLASGSLFAPMPRHRIVNFVAFLSLLMVGWEGSKAFADAQGYRIDLDLDGWDYQTYASLDDGLDAVEDGDINALIVDRNDVRDLMHAYPPEVNTDATPPAYPNLYYIQMDPDEKINGFQVLPEFLGRFRVVVRASNVTTWDSLTMLHDEPVGAVTESTAIERYLSQPRQLMLLDMSILTDLNLPHLQNIAEALFQPARRNGDVLLGRILLDAAIYTAQEALLAFLIGSALGFLIGTLLAHSGALRRGLLPYVVASQTIPILAIAPMVVVWLGPGTLTVAIIASYLTFFPVTINTLRGLQSPDAMSIELMHTYAASRWTILWKLRFPTALPYIFTALKVSATASVVGAIVGELPSSVGDGLARIILDFSSNYSVITTPKLWGAICFAALVGIVFFLAINLLELLVFRWQRATGKE